MKISELITKLHAKQRELGDVDICLLDHVATVNDIKPIEDGTYDVDDLMYMGRVDLPADVKLDVGSIISSQVKVDMIGDRLCIMDITC